MKGYQAAIETATLTNKNFRRVLHTSTHLQLVVMNLEPGEEIGLETHQETDQFFRFEQGQGRCVIDKTEYVLRAGDIIIVPAGAKHNIINTDNTTALKFYTIYSPPHHKDGIVQATKKEAEKSEEKFEGVTTD